MTVPKRSFNVLFSYFLHRFVVCVFHLVSFAISSFDQQRKLAKETTLLAQLGFNFNQQRRRAAHYTGQKELHIYSIHRSAATRSSE